MAREFQGKIELDVRDSQPDWEAFLPGEAPQGAPNVLVVLYDDAGQAAWSHYGGRIDMPTMDRLAAGGLTYWQWHTTALCSPTRSALLTGRDHHLNGFASISESSTGFPGYSSHIPTENATMANVLREAGWSTFWVGKNHNIPINEWTAGASKKRWPLGQGYDRFYGFIGGETNNWYPSLAEDNHTLPAVRARGGLSPPEGPGRPGVADDPGHKQTEPDKPWYLWFYPGANHAPHHAPEEYIAKYKGIFDDGYEAYREWVLPRMIERGILPRARSSRRSTRCPTGTLRRGRPVQPWEALDAEKGTLFSRMAEMYAGFSEYTDAQVGRSSTTSRNRGSSTTRIIFYCADNSASDKGCPNGSVNEGKISAAIPTPRGEPGRDRRARVGPTRQPLPDGLGDGLIDPVPDVQALHRTRAGSATRSSSIRRPGHPRDRVRCGTSTTTAPTSCRRSTRACGVTMPDVVDGAEQTPLSGVSMLYSFNDTEDPTAKKRVAPQCSGTAASGTRAGRRWTEHGPISGDRATSTRTPGSSSTPTWTGPRRTTSPAQHPEKLAGAHRSVV